MFRTLVIANPAERRGGCAWHALAIAKSGSKVHRTFALLSVTVRELQNPLS